MEKSWVWFPRNSIEYAEGTQNFVNASSKSLNYPTEIICPCIDCRNVSHQPVNTVLDHLVIRGMDHKYKRKAVWSMHGDTREDKKDDGQIYGLDAYDLFRTAFSNDEESPQSPKPSGSQFNNGETTEESEFCKKLNEAETPLYSTCHNYTKVSAIMGLYRIKVKSGMSENYFDQLLTMVHDMLPDDNILPKSTDEIKRFLKVFGFGYDVIHACKNDCILYRKQYAKMETCPRCSASRWEIDKHSENVKNGIPAKVLRYFPIKVRFQRMFRSRRITEQLRWHFSNAAEDGTMRHPVDSITWAQVNDNWPEFAAEPRNLRLGISTDGMNPFSIQNTKYSTWPVLLVNYNMSPVLCMKAENIMLTMLIPGPTAPSNNIDVYLQPLVDDLKDLWDEGIEVYDSYLKEKFTLKALLLWSISDYPALGTLSGCKVKGKQACNVCGKDTPHRWLKFSKKYVYLGNRKRLRPGHPYRRKKGWFDNTVENGTAEGIICSVDPTKKVNQIPLGPNAAVIKVQKVIDHDAFLWRPSAELAVMGDAVNETIAWPLDKIELATASPEVSRKTSPETTSKSTGSSKGAKKKCILFDCSGSGKIVAEGRVCSTDPDDRVHFIPLGPNASKVWVDVSKIGDADVWRPNSEVECVADAIGTTVAWPNDKLKLL